MPTTPYLQTMTGTNVVMAPKFRRIDIATAGDNEIVAAVPGKKIKVYAFLLNTLLAVSVQFKSGPGNDPLKRLSGSISLGANDTLALAVSLPSWLMETTAGEAFVVSLGTAVQASGFVAYWDTDDA